MKRRNIHLSHVRKDGKSWYYAIDMGKNSEGKRQIKKKRGFKTQKEAKAALTALEASINNGTFIEPSKMLYGDFLSKWLRTKSTIIKKSTMGTYKNLVDGHIIPALGDIRLCDISSNHIENVILDIKEQKTLSDENIQKVYTLIKGSLNKAVVQDLISKNECVKVDRPSAQRKEMKVWDLNEVQTFLKAAKGEMSYTLFHLALTTAMRQAELIGLRWHNVDLENGTIVVTEQLERYTHNFVSLKTKAAYRNISIDQETVRELIRQKERIEFHKKTLGSDYTDLNLVCPTSVGTPFSPSNLSKIQKRIMKAAELKQIRFHDLRHTSATLLLPFENPKIVAEKLGHADTRITLDVYSHLLPNMQKNTANKLGDLLFGADIK